METGIDLVTLLRAVSEGGALAFAFFAYWRASTALQQSRKYAERREARLLRLLWHLCGDDGVELDEID
jgi:hypothetical protein